MHYFSGMISLRFFKDLLSENSWQESHPASRRSQTFWKRALNPNMRLLSLLLALPFLAWLLPLERPKNQVELSPQKINLALRRTADGLLRASGDSTSRIPAIEQTAQNVWQVRLEQPFQYEQLPALLQASLDLHGIQQPYNVAVRQCADATIDLGYHQLDFLQNKNMVPCGGRQAPSGCHYIEVTFLEMTPKQWTWLGKTGLFLFLLSSLSVFFYLKRKKTQALERAENISQGENSWLHFGNSRLDLSNQTLVFGSTAQSLTFRETKLLQVFASHPNQLLERDFLLQEVWANEGILVGRSVDVFVSRLRKKLQPDPTLSIVAVHGVGYRMEVA